MAGKEGKLALGRCTAGHKADETSLRGCTAQHKSATEPMEVGREDALLERKAEEEIYKVLVAEILHKRPGVAAASEVTEPMLVHLAKAAVPQALAESGMKEAVSQPHAEIGMKEAVSEPQAEEPDTYEDEAEDDYEDDAEDDEAGDDYDYEEEEYDYEPHFLEQRPKVRALVLNFPEAAHLQLHELDKVVDRIMEQSKPECADLAAPGKIRLLREDIELAIVPNWFYDDTPLTEPEKEFLPLDQERERFRAKVRKDLTDKGFVEVDEDYYDKKDEYERQMMEKIEEEWNQKMYLSRFRVANNEEGILCYSEEHGGYI